MPIIHKINLQVNLLIFKFTIYYACMISKNSTDTQITTKRTSSNNPQGPSTRVQTYNKI
ncbi:hypothetical protein C2G38_2125893, partial [Gigaspora rosea]